MNKEVFRKMEREYNIWLQKHPKGDHNYKSFTHMRRSLEFAEYWYKKQVNDAKAEKGQALHKHFVNCWAFVVTCVGKSASFRECVIAESEESAKEKLTNYYGYLDFVDCVKYDLFKPCS